MKLVFVSDIHIGEHKRLEDTKAALDFVTATAAQVQPTHLIILGDVFDKRKPTPRELRTFNKWLLDIRAEVSAHVLVLEGNHDQDRDISTLTYLQDLSVDRVRVVKPPFVFDKFYLGHEHVDGAIADNGIALTGGRKLDDIINAHPQCLVFAFGDFHRPQILRDTRESSEKPVLAFYAGSLTKTSFGERDDVKKLWVFENTELLKTIDIPSRKMIQYDIHMVEDMDGQAPWIGDILDGALVKVVYHGSKSALAGVDTTSVKDYLIHKKTVKELRILFDVINDAKPRNEKINESAEDEDIIVEYFSRVYKGDHKEKLLDCAKDIINDTQKTKG